ncbi:unnamed protein product [Effrenium voratum]|uniref:Uncharacterized protein n=1 Tax=Effrenium voratum TaxID=2562239 RepID=A0AA36JP39_9DINO|nr:unnamed protein product [Effrenium voratum]
MVAEDEDIVGREIGSAVPLKQQGRAVPSAPKRPKVEQVSSEEEEEEEEDAEEVPPLARAQPSEPRLEVEPGANVRENAVHVYGLDFLKTSHMEEIFSQFGHKYVEWINESSANIIFKNAEGAKKALEALSFPKTEDEPWRRTPDILVGEGVPPIFLQMRLATVKDHKQAKRSVPKAMSPMHYAQVFYKNQAQGARGRPRPNSAKAKPKAGTKRLQVTPEESQKRQKRGERFGDDEEVIVVGEAKKGADKAAAEEEKATEEPKESTEAPEKESTEAPAAEAPAEQAPAAEAPAEQAPAAEAPAEAPAEDAPK